MCNNFSSTALQAAGDPGTGETIQIAFSEGVFETVWGVGGMAALHRS